MVDAVDSVTVASLRGWIPVRVNVREATVEWAIVDEPAGAPFFEQTAHLAMQRPFNAIFAQTTPIDVLEAFADERDAAEPTGLVFHMSRCGSTLVAQMLSRVRRVAVFSEPQPLDGVLRLSGGTSVAAEAPVRRLRGLVNAFAAAVPEQRVVVKLNAWHALVLPLVARAWPSVPWIFLFREPRAVLQSHELSPGHEVLAGGVDPAYVGVRSPADLLADDYSARVLQALCRAALANASAGRALFVDYATLPDAVLTTIVPSFGLSAMVGDAEAAAMRAVAATDVKTGEPHVGGGGAAVSPRIETLAAAWLDETYAELKRAAVAR